MSPEALEALYKYDWPGNVRELKSTIERSVTRAYLLDETLQAPIVDIVFDALKNPWADETSSQTEKVVITTNPDSEPDTPSPATTDFSERVMVFERGLIDEAMQIAGQHQGKAAEHLNLTYHQFRGLLRKHGLKK